jgi:hypothetical protein
MTNGGKATERSLRFGRDDHVEAKGRGDGANREIGVPRDGGRRRVCLRCQPPGKRQAGFRHGAASAAAANSTAAKNVKGYGEIPPLGSG